jgi:glycogen synthase
MVLGYLIATGIETGLELGFWSLRKLFNGIYTITYGNDEDESREKEEEKKELKALREEITELKELIQIQSKDDK